MLFRSGVAQPLSPFLYALVLGWSDNQEVRSLLQKSTLPKLPIHIVLALCAINDNEESVSACIDRMIEITLEQGYALPAVYMHGLQKWASSLNAETLLRRLITEHDCSRKITAVRLLSITGKLSDTDRLGMINDFNEVNSDFAKHGPRGP